MTRSTSLKPLRLALALALAISAVFVLAACGDSDDEESDQKLSVTLSGETFQAPGGAEAGSAEISFKNNSDKTADMQFIRVEGDHSPKEVIQALGEVMNGKPFEDWMFAGGGVAVVKPGESKTVDQVLSPGTYYLFNTESDGPPDPSATASFEVSGDESDTELEADATVTAEDADKEYSFTADNVSSGNTEILFDNEGEQPHHLLLAPIKGDATVEDIETAFKEEKGPPPIEEKGSESTAVIEGGEAQLVTLKLEPGRYAMFCFITDRKGGKPHALKGMVDEVEVE